MDNHSHELNPAESNTPSKEIPMPEEQTGDAPDLEPTTEPHLAGRFDETATPDHPPSDRA